MASHDDAISPFAKSIVSLIATNTDLADVRSSQSAHVSPVGIASDFERQATNIPMYATSRIYAEHSRNLPGPPVRSMDSLRKPRVHHAKDYKSSLAAINKQDHSGAIGIPSLERSDECDFRGRCSFALIAPASGVADMLKSPFPPHAKAEDNPCPGCDPIPRGPRFPRFPRKISSGSDRRYLAPQWKVIAWLKRWRSTWRRSPWRSWR